MSSLRERTFQMDGRHGAQVAESHVEGILEVRLVFQNEAGRLLSAIVEESDLVDLVKLASLGRNVTGGESETLPKIGRPSPIDELAHDLSIVVLVKLVEENSVEATEIFHDSNNDIQEVFQILSTSKLVVDLVENGEHIEGVRDAASASAPTGAASATSPSGTSRCTLDRRATLAVSMPEVAELALYTDTAQRLRVVRCRR